MPDAQRTLIYVFVVAALAWPAVSAAQINDGTIEVSVVDETGASLGEVTITTQGLDTGLVRVAVTSDAGTARILAIPPGHYRVSFDRQGFSTAAPENVVLRSGQTARLAVTMLVAGISEAVTVSAAIPVVDVYKMDSSSNIVPEQIESLPVADRDFQRLSFLVPGVQRERGAFRFIAGGPVVGASGNASQATILVDGMDFTDPSLGLARARFGQDAISEFRVITNRFDAEVGGSAGGAISVVTKSGTNTHRGGVFAFYRGERLRARGAYELDEVEFSRWHAGFTAGGPIARDRVHYFSSVEQVGENELALFRPGGTLVSQAADFPHPRGQTLLFASLDHRVSDQHGLDARVAYERYRERNFRVGGNQDESYGQRLDRDNWNLLLGHRWVLGQNLLNTLQAQIGGRRYEEPTNSNVVAEWFSGGNTLRTGTNIVGNLLGESIQWEVRDSVLLTLDRAGASHTFKTGFSLQHIRDRLLFPAFEQGLLVYALDNRLLPLSYIFGVGVGDATVTPNVISAYFQDDFRPAPNLTVGAGVRYDLNTAGNNPGFTHPLSPEPRKRDINNLQPRVGFSWDLLNNGRYVVRGGVGRFTGRFLLAPAFAELQQNGVTGRVIQSRVNGALLGSPQFTLDPRAPATTGLPLQKDSTLLDSEFVAPESLQATLGWTTRLGMTNLYVDVEGIYAKGRDDIVIRDANFSGNEAVVAGRPARLNPAWNQVNRYTNEGRSAYKAFVVGLNGTVMGRHIVTASATIADKKNVSDDFSPEFPFGYPNDPSQIGAEWGRSRADERLRVVMSGVFRLPLELQLAPIFEYGSGQPWTRRLGYDFNGDGKNSDRAQGIPRNGQDGPSYSQLSLRVAKRLRVNERSTIELIAEAFNLFNRRNDDVASLVNSGGGAEFLAGPTLANRNIPVVANPGFGRFTAALPPREIQLGVRLAF